VSVTSVGDSVGDGDGVRIKHAPTAPATPARV